MTTESMVELALTLHLPDVLAREATNQGILNAETLENLIRAEVKRRRIERLFSAADVLANQSSPAMNESEIEQEIHAVRASKPR